MEVAGSIGAIMFAQHTSSYLVKLIRREFLEMVEIMDSG